MALGISTRTLIFFILIITLFLYFLFSLILMFVTKLFKLKDTTYKTAMKVTLFVIILSFISGLLQYFINPSPFVFDPIGFLFLFIVGFLAIWLVKKQYFLDWGKAVGVGVIWYVISTFISGIILFILTFTILS